jgi:hypothetical protein
MTSEQLDRVYAEADADLVARTRALTAESVAKLNVTLDAVLAMRPRLVVDEVKAVRACVRCPEPLPEDESVTNPLGLGLMHNDCRTDMLREDHRCVVCAEPLRSSLPVCVGCIADYREDMR